MKPTPDAPSPSVPARWSAWWGGLSDPQRFRIYTRLVTVGATLALAAAMAISVRNPWQVLALIIVAPTAALLLESRPELSAWMAASWRGRARRAGAGVLVVVAAANALVVHTTNDEDLARDAKTVGFLVLLVGATAVVTFLTHRWQAAVDLGLLAGPAYGITPRDMAATALFGVVITGSTVAVTLLTQWGLRVVDDLERARSAEAQLKVAQERLRFARDLHDVVGRGFSAVAVKSELATTFTRAGATDRAVAEMEGVKTLAVESLEEVRALVRGYRDISLSSEVAGARSLLSAAGCQLTVVGEADHVPKEYHEVAAWVVREGTTNIVRHTSATEATLSLGSEGMTLSNDDATNVGPARSGHTGLAERLDAVGATMRTGVDGGHHVLQVRWENA